MDIKGLEKRIKELKTKLKDKAGDLKILRTLRKQLKRAQRRSRSLAVKAAMIEAKAKKKKGQEKAA